MPDDRNSKLAVLLAEAVDDTPDDLLPGGSDEALCRRREASPLPRPLCPDCGDVVGDGINCPSCQAIRAAKHQRTPGEQAVYDKAKTTRPIDATPVRDWRRKHLPPGNIPEGKSETSDESPETTSNTKGIDMAARLPKGEMPPLQSSEPPRAGAKKCENPRGNPKCSGMTGKRLCRSCGILESRIARGLVDGDAMPPAAPAREQTAGSSAVPERVDPKAAARPAVARHVVPDADGLREVPQWRAVHVIINRRAALVVLEVLDNLSASWIGQVREAYSMGLVAGSIRVGLAT